VNLELFIAKRILSGKNDNKSISKPIVKIAIIGIALGLCVMILSVAIVTGFKKEIYDKATGFSSDIQLTNFDNNNTYETTPLRLNNSIKKDINSIEGVRHSQYFATKPGILKNDNEIQGIILHGTGKDFDSTFIKKNIVDGKIYSLKDSVKSNSCLISENLSKMMKIKLGDKVNFWFIQQPARQRRFTVSGIYNTGMQDFDNLFIFCDIRHVQKLNNWKEDQYSGLEIMIDDIKEIDQLYPQIKHIASQYSGESQTIRTLSIKSKYPELFDWLDMLDMNVWIILALMIAVSGFNMVSGLLIIILEKTSMIGILKAIGQNNLNIRKTFLFLSIRLVGQGLLWGNIAGISLCLIQKYGNIIKLDPVNYYLNTVPININLTHFLLLNLGTLSITILMLVIPSMIISKISPIKAIKFE
jgi:lipoprotein-releasing system permease protein